MGPIVWKSDFPKIETMAGIDMPREEVEEIIALLISEGYVRDHGRYVELTMPPGSVVR